MTRGNTNGTADMERSADATEESGMTRQDAGRMGGQTTKERYGSDFYSNIGRAGGKARGEK